MTDQNNADQAIQEAERNAAAEEYFGHRTWIKPTASNFRLFEAGFDRAYALLSKLRAEGVQAADERAAFEAAYEDEFAFVPVWLDHLNDGKGAYASSQQRNDYRMWQRRAALASAPVAPRACPTDVCQAAKADGVLCANGVRPASAPVAGEAVYQIKLPGDTESVWRDSTEAAFWTVTAKHRRIVYAAPQASEAVRNPSLIDLLIRAQAWMVTVRGANRPNNLIRLIDDALKTQADKND